jgi:hypothetical protein
MIDCCLAEIPREVRQECTPGGIAVNWNVCFRCFGLAGRDALLWPEAEILGFWPRLGSFADLTNRVLDVFALFGQ